MFLCSRIRVRSVFPIYRNGVRGMNTLREILVDAARYRWLKENVREFVLSTSLIFDAENGNLIGYVNAKQCDNAIDEALSDE